MTIRVGASGWSYDDWVGTVYPRRLPPGEWLAFYAERFPSVEVNVTFYRTPPPPTILGWLAKTKDAPRFELTVKAPRDLSERLLAEGAPSDVDAFAREWATEVLAPLAFAGRLGAVLLQLAPSVRRDAATLERLDAALAALRGHEVAVELRHSSWLARGAVAEEAIALLDAHGAALAALDGPSFPAILAGSARHAYVRMHGRNRDLWFGKEDPAEEDARLNRYHYDYSDAELDPWAARLAEIAREKGTVRVYFNNHPEGLAFRNAGRFEELLEARGAAVERARGGPQKSLDSFE